MCINAVHFSTVHYVLLHVTVELLLYMAVIYSLKCMSVTTRLKCISSAYYDDMAFFTQLLAL